MATLKQLKIFIAVAEYKKMSEAAKKLYISQPTVSQVISDLEDEYETQLFNRLSKKLEITPSGLILLNNAKEIVSIHQKLEQTMKTINSQRPLRIGATVTIGNILMATLVEKLNQQHPDIDATVYVDNTKIIEQKILHNELDLALIEGIITRQEITAQPVIEDCMCLICGNKHPFASKPAVCIEDLRHQNFILREKGSGTRAIFENYMLTHQSPYAVKWECTSRCAIIDAVRHNLGLSVLSKQCVIEYAEKGDVIICQVENISMKRFFHLCRNRFHPITSQMKDFTDIVMSISNYGSRPSRQRDSCEL